MASRLRKLNVSGCWMRYLDLVKLLLPCTALEELCIGGQFDNNDTKINPANFLPQLKSLELTTCLERQWQRVFEARRPHLISLRFSCCHIGMAPGSNYQWTDVSYLWPNLKSLKIQSAVGLSPAVIQEHIIKALPKLEQLMLPLPVANQWKSSDKIMAELKEQLESSVVAPRKLTVSFFDIYYTCHFTPGY